AVGQQELPFYREYVPWVTDFLHSHKAELRLDANTTQVANFVSHVARATIDNYVLHGPDQLTDPLIEDLLIDLLERFLLEP
ncbi:MAG: hypothetical protein AAFQ21_12410, partial [Pseudomonadota bacterium]